MGANTITTITKTTTKERRHRDEEGGERPWERVVDHLYRQNFDALCGLAQRLLDTRYAAEEAVQESFARFAALPTRPRTGCELAYLQSIVMNIARSTLRRNKMREREDREYLVCGEADTTGDEVVAHDREAAVRQCIDALPLRQRQVVTLRHLVGLSERETAAVLAISAGSVKTHCSRGLSAIRDRIGDAG